MSRPLISFLCGCGTQNDAAGLDPSCGGGSTQNDAAGLDSVYIHGIAIAFLDSCRGMQTMKCVVAGDREVDKVGLLIRYTTGRYHKEPRSSIIMLLRYY